jgi:proton-dependent oligopeptide transporter, POT family
VLIVLTVSTVVFWALFEQSAASMTLFADRVVDRTVLGFTFTAGQLGALNPMFIVLLAPVFAWLWIRLAALGREPSTPVKFALGIMQAGLGFGALLVGSQFPDEAGRVALVWIVLAYLLHTTGELCLSPVGLSAVTKLAVLRVVGVMMGAWFLATAYAETLAAQLAKIAAIATDAGAIADIAAARATYDDLWAFLLGIGLGASLVMLLLSPWLRRRMHGVH